LKLGINVGFLGIRFDEYKKALGFHINPAMAYVYQTPGKFFVGVEFRPILPATGVDDTYDYPFAAMFSIPIGWATSPHW
ncbi:MAG: hypothetical protein V1754_00095, partial [Pseudomonadota bacterium]